MRKFLFLVVGLSLFSCSPKTNCSLSCISIVDRNGLSETISTSERLATYEHVDFLQPQTYQKVTRVYQRDPCGGIPSVVTNYYPSGKVKQCLECYNGSAQGNYQEWHSNGRLKLSVAVLGGPADLSAGSELNWIFDGIAQAWDNEGRLEARIPYSNGQLHGEAEYYHPNGRLWKHVPYDHGQIHGDYAAYTSEGTLFERCSYEHGAREGESLKYWPNGEISCQEDFQAGRLISGIYTDSFGKDVAKVAQGQGVRAIFGKDRLIRLEEVRNGLPEGEVREFTEDQKLLRTYQTKDGLKHGVELVYFSQQRPRMAIPWFKGMIQGTVKTWYPNGQLESQREMSQNRRQGLASAWYSDGKLMLIEEYENDRLSAGKYLRAGEKLPVSQVVDGEGLVTLFDPEGQFLKKIKYEDGRPIQ